MTPFGRRPAAGVLGLAAVAAVLLGVAWAALPRHLGHASGAGGVVITPIHAELVLAHTWYAREAARSGDELAQLSAVDSGAALARDLNLSQEARALGDWSERVERPLGRNRVFVPVQTKYPAVFLAAVQTSSQWSGSAASHEPLGAATALLVLVEERSGAPWKVALETGYQGGLSDNAAGIDLEPGNATGGYVPAAPRPAWIDPASSIAKLTALYNHYAEYGEAPSGTPLLPGPWTTGQGESIAAVGLNGRISPRGFTNAVTYSASSASFQFDVDGSNVTCGTVEGEASAAALPGGYLYQPPDRHNWGGSIAPGRYSTISNRLEHQVCLAIAPTQVGGITALSGDDRESSLNSWSTPATVGAAGAPASA